MVILNISDCDVENEELKFSPQNLQRKNIKNNQLKDQPKTLKVTNGHQTRTIHSNRKFKLLTEYYYRLKNLLFK